MRIGIVALGAMAIATGGCGPGAETSAPDQVVASNDATSSDRPSPSPGAVENAVSDTITPTNATTRMTIAPMIGEKIARAEWSKAANRASCAPLALKSDAKAGGTARAATYSGGWAVAFDQRERRSAYGFAGVGALPDDRLDFALQVDRLARQWPYVRRWDEGDNLPVGSAAGYGLEGFQDYPSGSSGFGRQSVAYLRIPGQSCLYNIWSRLGRDHLELVLGELVLLRP